MNEALHVSADLFRRSERDHGVITAFVDSESRSDKNEK